MDGQLYNHAATLVWPAGSKHIVAFVVDPPQNNQTSASTTQTTTDGSTQYQFNGWTDNAGLLVPNADPVQTITANPAITTIQAKLAVSYRLMVNFYNTGVPGNPVSPPVCGAPGVNPSSQLYPGVVYIGSQCYWSTVSLYVPQASVLNLNAIPYSGFVFIGWAINSGPVNPYLTSITVNGPTHDWAAIFSG